MQNNTLQQGLHGLDGEVWMKVRCFEKNPRGLQFYERGGLCEEAWH
jgi:hypothetical protein